MTFITENFLLSNETGRKLYFDYAKGLPIIDYHNHLDPKAIAENRSFENLTQLWLAGDHYKWRAMRANGIEEKFISGDATDKQKFWKWSLTVPKTLRNPLFHWTHMELKFPFGIDELLNEESGMMIYMRANEQLLAPEFTVQGLLKQFNVETLCTTDDPLDDLTYHKPPHILPTWRPDQAYTFFHPVKFKSWVSRLSRATGMRIKRFHEFIEALDKRHQFFHDRGCRLADHGLSWVPGPYEDNAWVEGTFRRLSAGLPEKREVEDGLANAILIELLKMNHKRGWTQQLHIGPIRNTNRRLMKTLGADAGCDSIGDWNHAEPLAALLNSLDRDDKLAPTILYNSNPSDNAVFSTMAGNFNDGSRPNKVQHGAAWWFLDQRDGIRDHLNSISNYGLLAHFVGMLTDSRSFLSFSRHDYFRRILCDLLGAEMEAGLLPNDLEWIGGMVQDICYRNAKGYFGFDSSD